VQKWPTLSGMGLGAVGLIFTTTGYIESYPEVLKYSVWTWIAVALINVGIGFALGYFGTVYLAKWLAGRHNG
jgi:hypothetical protein